jgi:hypothetical protein
MKDIVKVTCYGTTKEYERQDAIKKFLEGMMFCEGSERERYVNIYLGLMKGCKEVSDVEEF